MVTPVNTASFPTEVTKASGIVVADFWAEWCGPCKRYGPEFEKIAASHTGGAKFVKVNVEEAEEIAMQLGVQSIPTTIFFKDGKESHREVGILSKEFIEETIKHLA